MNNEIKNKYKCPCCGYFTFEQEADHTFQLCPVCFWEDDGIQLNDPDYDGGANVVSLNQARKNFIEFGASEKRFREFVRPPDKDEIQFV